MSSLLANKYNQYWQLIKPIQTGFLLVTGFTGLISTGTTGLSWDIYLSLIGSQFFIIIGSMIINTVYNRDINFKLDHTSRRPLPTSGPEQTRVLFSGFLVSALGILWALSLSFLFGIILFAGLFLNVAIYTVWLKKITPWSIILRAISGGTPILAGRVLGTGQIDLIGLLLFLAIVLWLPTHTLTFDMVYENDNKNAGIPTFPSIYGYKYTRLIIALCNIGAALVMGTGIYALGMTGGHLRLLSVLIAGLLGLAMLSIYHPSEKTNLGLFKYTSMYMLGSMLLVIIGI